MEGMRLMDPILLIAGAAVILLAVLIYDIGRQT